MPPGGCKLEPRDALPLHPVWDMLVTLSRKRPVSGCDFAQWHGRVLSICCSGGRGRVIVDVMGRSMEVTAVRPVVLVVDDTPLNLMLIENILAKDYTLQLVSNPHDGLDYAFASPPDLILLDIVMPDMDGFEVCRRLKANPNTRDVPVIFITAKQEVEDEELGFSVGASDFIHKPISAPIVAARVRTHLKIKLMQDYLINENTRLQTHATQNLSELEQLKSFMWGAQYERR